MSGGPGVPGWLLAPNPEPASPPRGRGRFVAASLGGVARTMASVHDEDAGGWPARLAASPKLVGALGWLIAVALLRTPAVVGVAALALVAALAAAGRTYVRTAVVLWVPALVLGLLVSGPMAFSAVRPGPLAVALWEAGGVRQGLTWAGLTTVVLMLGRVVCSLAVLVLLTRSTPWLRLMSALGALGLPRAMVMIATMAHRYLIVLADVLADRLLARRARTVSGTRGRDDRAFVGASVAALLTRASALADEVHQAMVARGYDGRPPRGPAAAGRPTAGVRLRTAAVSGALLVPAILLVIGDVLAR